MTITWTAYGFTCSFCERQTDFVTGEGSMSVPMLRALSKRHGIGRNMIAAALAGKSFGDRAIASQSLPSKGEV